MGQNIATSWTYPRPNALGATPEFAKQITNWFNEVRGYHFRSTSSATGHYSQLIWGDSHLVGCGYAYYHDQSRGYTKVYVCNYGPGGNIAGYAPYQTGAPACPRYGTKPSSKYPGLCCKYPYITVNIQSLLQDSLSLKRGWRVIDLIVLEISNRDMSQTCLQIFPD